MVVRIFYMLLFISFSYSECDDFNENMCTENQTCEYSIENDAGYITTDSPYLFSANCYGDFDQNLGKICEELTIEECQGSNECIIEDDNILFYTFQLFRPFGYPHCGGFGNVKFQFVVTDKIGLEDVSEEIIVEIVP